MERDQVRGPEARAAVQDDRSMKLVEFSLALFAFAAVALLTVLR